MNVLPFFAVNGHSNAVMNVLSVFAVNGHSNAVMNVLPSLLLTDIVML